MPSWAVTLTGITPLRRNRVAQLKAVPGDLQRRDRGRAGVDGKEQVALADESALRVQRRPGAQATGGDGLSGGQPAVGGAVEHLDRVATAGVCRLVDVPAGSGPRMRRRRSRSRRTRLPWRRPGWPRERGSARIAVHGWCLS